MNPQAMAKEILKDAQADQIQEQETPKRQTTWILHHRYQVHQIMAK